MKGTDDLTEEQVLSLQNSRWNVCLCDFNAFCMSFVTELSCTIQNHLNHYKCMYLFGKKCIYL